MILMQLQIVLEGRLIVVEWMVAWGDLETGLAVIVVFLTDSSS